MYEHVFQTLVSSVGPPTVNQSLKQSLKRDYFYLVHRQKKKHLILYDAAIEDLGSKLEIIDNW